ncbi:MAG TPA: YigZ family protein [Bacilli bacterium]|nr:YigZ family protein [Bacilli bacterium]
MKLIKTNTLEIKKSKFISYYYQIDNKEEVKDILNTIKKEHRKAKHFPYAYKIDNLIKKSDDKEPSNTAGTPILYIIEQNNLNNSLIVIVRYFGGIKLGVGGLYRAYLGSAKEVIK